MDKLILMTLTGAAAAAAFVFLRLNRQDQERQALKAEIKKWEDEGGNVPEVPTVSPAATPDTTVPTRR